VVKEEISVGVELFWEVSENVSCENGADLVRSWLRKYVDGRTADVAIER
jgi:hypothetical protein